jgi:plasmid maintenance system antidote protein VapI
MEGPPSALVKRYAYWFCVFFGLRGSRRSGACFAGAKRIATAPYDSKTKIKMAKFYTAEEAALIYYPDEAIAPRETLLDLMEEREVSVEELARRMGWTPQEAARLLDDALDAPMTREAAEALARAFALPADFWLGCERIYRILQRQERARAKESSKSLG